MHDSSGDNDDDDSIAKCQQYVNIFEVSGSNVVCGRTSVLCTW